MARTMYVSVNDIMHDPDQTKIYNLKKDKRYIVEGCAGSGKSSLALLLLQKVLAERGENDAEGTPVYYVTTAHELTECVRQQFASFKLETPLRYNDYAITGGANGMWGSGKISDLQRKDQVPGGPYLINSRQCMLRRYITQGRFRCFTNEDIVINKSPDYLLVDEAQDFNRGSIEDFLNSARRGCVFYGDDTQSIMGFAQPMDLSAIEVLLKSKYGETNSEGREIIYKYTLKRNWRLSKEVAAFAQSLPNGVADPDLLLRCRGEYHERPIVSSKSSEVEMIDYIRKFCINATLDDDVGIILRSNEEVRRFYEGSPQLGHSGLRGLGNVSARYSIDGNGCMPDDYRYLRNTPVKIMTYENAKGQQFRDVFLIGSEDVLTDEQGLNRFYVGVTRAERFLRILHTGAVPSFIQSIDPDLWIKE